MTAPLYNLTDTWANGATVFTAILMNVTRTASADTSKFLDLQLGGTSVFDVVLSGLHTKAQLRMPYSTSDSSLFTMGWSSASQFQLVWPAGYTSTFLFGSTCPLFLDGSSVWIGNGQSFGFGTSANAGTGSQDTILVRDAAAILAQRNGVNAQTFRVYNTFTDASNYERGGFDWNATANILRIRSEAAGTGTKRPIAIDAYSKSGAPTSTELPAGTGGIFKDTGGGGVVVAYNDGGTIKTAALT